MKTYTDEELLKLDPELEKIFKTKGHRELPIPSKKTLPIFRENYANAIAKYTQSPFSRAALGDAFSNPTWTEKDYSVPVRDGSQITIRTYVPHDLPDGGLPVIIFVHGGGWLMGNLDTEALNCRLFAAKLGIIAVNVDYRLYPDVSFGVPATDTIDAVQWVSENAGSFGGNLGKGFIVGGNSGGATFAAIAVHLLRDARDGGAEGPLKFPVTGQYHSCPIFTDEMSLKPDGSMEYKYTRPPAPNAQNRSPEQCFDAPLMNNAMRMSIRNFAEYDWTSPLMGPFHCPPFTGLPRTYVQVCGLDPWRDSGILYETEVREGGAEGRLDVYPGLPHAFWTTFPQLSATNAYLRDMLKGVRWLLEVDGKGEASKL